MAAVCRVTVVTALARIPLADAKPARALIDLTWPVPSSP